MFADITNNCTVNSRALVDIFDETIDDEKSYVYKFHRVIALTNIPYSADQNQAPATITWLDHFTQPSHTMLLNMAQKLNAAGGN